jgi:hypothetical protein
MRAIMLLAFTLAACEPERGEGVYPRTAAEREADTEAKFQAGEKLGLGGLRVRLHALGVKESEIAQVVEPDHGVTVLQLAFGPDRLRALDSRALADLVLDSNFRLTFADPATARAVPVAEEDYRRERLAEVAVLKRHGDWQRVPRQRLGESVASIARRVEHWCDFDPGDALRVIDGAWLDYRHAPVDTAVRELGAGPASDKFDCLRRTVYATQLRRRFIGYRGRPPPPVY